MIEVFTWKDDIDREIFRIEGSPETQSYIAFRPDPFDNGRLVSFATIEGDEALKDFMNIIRLVDRAGHTKAWKESRAKAIQEFKNSVANLK